MKQGLKETSRLCRQNVELWCLQENYSQSTCFMQYVTARTAQDIIPNLQLVKTLMSKFLPIRGYNSMPCKARRKEYSEKKIGTNWIMLMIRWTQRVHFERRSQLEIVIITTEYFPIVLHQLAFKTIFTSN